MPFGFVGNLGNRVRLSGYQKVRFGSSTEAVPTDKVVLDVQQSGYDLYRATLRYFAFNRLSEFTIVVTSADAGKAIPSCRHQ